MTFESVPGWFTWNKLSAPISWANPGKIKRVPARIAILGYTLRIGVVLINPTFQLSLHHLSRFGPILLKTVQIKSNSDKRWCSTGSVSDPNLTQTTFCVRPRSLTLPVVHHCQVIDSPQV